MDRLACSLILPICQKLVLVKQPGSLGAAEPPLNGTPPVVDLPPQLGEPRNYTDDPQQLAFGLLRVPGVAVVSPVHPCPFSQTALAGATEVVIPLLCRFLGIVHRTDRPTQSGRPSSSWVPSNSRCPVSLSFWGRRTAMLGTIPSFERVLEVGQGVVALVSQQELGLEPGVTLQRVIQVLGEMGSLILVGRPEGDVQGYSVDCVGQSRDLCSRRNSSLRVLAIVLSIGPRASLGCTVAPPGTGVSGGLATVRTALCAV